jgi:hypothetical protein
MERIMLPNPENGKKLVAVVEATAPSASCPINPMFKVPTEDATNHADPKISSGLIRSIVKSRFSRLETDPCKNSVNTDIGDSPVVIRSRDTRERPIASP